MSESVYTETGEVSVWRALFEHRSVFLDVSDGDDLGFEAAGIYLTPDQAREVAARLVKVADEIEGVEG